jgi:ABC-2 type transport system ATP-binding protein
MQQTAEPVAPGRAASNGETLPATRAARPVIELNNVSKAFGDTIAVRGLSFRIHEGEIFGLIGPSGSGKTTSIRLMNGMYRPSEGSVTVFGEPADKMSTRTREGIGYLPQLFILYPNLSVQQNINFSASLYGMGWLSRRPRRREVLEFVELWDHRSKLARNISGGMQRRLELACSLIHDPKLVFLDEPTAGIDPILRAKFWDSFRQLKAQGRTLFVTTQYVTEAEYCDHVAVLANGRMVVLDTPNALRRRAYGGELIEVRSPKIDQSTYPLFSRLEGVTSVDTSVPGRARLVVEDAPATIPVVIEALRAQSLEVESVEQYRPTFEEVFVRLLQDQETSDV